MKKIFLLSLSAVVIFASSCETTSFYRQTHSMTTSNIQNSSWQLMTISGFISEQLKNDVTITFSGDNKVSGFGGCNSFNANYANNGSVLTFSDIIATQRACMPGSKTEAAFFKALKNTASSEIKDGHLHLLDNRGNVLAMLVPIR